MMRKGALPDINLSPQALIDCVAEREGGGEEEGGGGGGGGEEGNGRTNMPSKCIDCAFYFPYTAE